jgi:5'-deoxynucleotidase YfbR-like HD superfamily hydrolase
MQPLLHELLGTDIGITISTFQAGKIIQLQKKSRLFFHIVYRDNTNRTQLERKMKPEKTTAWLNTVQKLSCVKRFSQSHLAKPESVLEHTGQVAMVCLHIGQLLIEEGHHVDMGALLKKALIHDIEESTTGDVSKPTKYHTQELRDQFAMLESDVAHKIFFDADVNLHQEWSEAKAQKEGMIVSFADTLCAILKFEDEILCRGNKTMSELLSQTAFATLAEKCEKLCEAYPIVDENKQINNVLACYHYEIISIKRRLEK